MSGSGKSTLIEELTKRGYKAVDTDWNPAWEEPSERSDGAGWLWREDRIDELLDLEDSEILFVAACVENQRRFYARFDQVVLLSVTPEITVRRLATRTSNEYGKRSDELADVLRYKETVEPLLRRAATLEIDTGAPLSTVVERVLALVEDQSPPPYGSQPERK